MNRRAVIVIVLLATAIGALRIGLDIRADRAMTDKQKIARVVQSTIAAAQRKDVNAIMHFVSPHFEAHGLTKPQIRAIVHQQLRDVSTIAITYTPDPPTIAVSGNEATVTFDRIALAMDSGPETYNVRGVTVTLRREEVRSYLIFHRWDWRFVTASDVAPLTSP